jgi:hypothetical protein
MAIKYKQKKSFKAQVDVVDLDGTKGFIECEFHYFNTTELAELGKEELNNAQLLKRILIGVTGFRGEEDNKELPADVQMEIVASDTAHTARVTQKFLEKITGAQKGN